MTDPLPPFSGDDPTCPKCGYADGAATTYRAVGRCLHDGSGHVFGTEDAPRLHRACFRCSFEWDEATIAAPDEFKVRDDALKRILEHLWNDLFWARRRAHRGAWSLECESLAERIETVSRIVGPLRPGAVPVSLLDNGLWERLNQEWGFLAPGSELAQVWDDLKASPIMHKTQGPDDT